jgi:hypothetical protein
MDAPPVDLAPGASGSIGFMTGPFLRLASAATISGLGDGVTQVAGAMLALSLTRSPLRLAGLLAAQQLPWASARPG